MYMWFDLKWASTYDFKLIAEFWGCWIFGNSAILSDYQSLPYLYQLGLNPKWWLTGNIYLEVYCKGWLKQLRGTTMEIKNP